MFENAKFVIDSRQAFEGCIFVALKGERTDGHYYVREALERGAALAVVERIVDVPKEKLYFVEDTRLFLQKLAAQKIVRYDPKIVGITGSNGKTTVKEMIHRCLGEEIAFRNPGNLNTEIGLPLSILNDYRGQPYMILEMAMNKPGDITTLCRIAQPHVSILLNVGTAHRGVAGGDEQILKGKLEIVENMRENGIAILHNDPRILQRVRRRDFVTFGFQSGDYRLTSYVYEGPSTRAWYETPKGVHQLRFSTILNVGQLVNVAAVLAVFSVLNLQVDLTKLESFVPVSGRFRVLLIDEVYVVDDTYNASLESFKVAVETLKKLGERTYAVVGSIKEQGIYSQETHRQLGKILEQLDGVFVYNADHEIDSMECSKILLKSDEPEVIVTKLKSMLRMKDAVLFKASRAVGMEKVLNLFLGGKAE
ncbi:UDP-N-acetylmuramoylalanyl-D-glutamate--2,6-diaminopimelate ligase [Thermotoga sp. Ku-13t]|uniref:UDP-N-acetylmuramoyl-tripeptide--D-alanyl-D- alanine ligase n=1 Tax=Thermotoga sp. Ku-13t TaxID=1755813 RepID=UPI0013EC6FD2|nr:UDP-N-acetylmuramoyl-tripeptide--D-alanyl-D-alanine ligase [Thermotoga sp. Ku-13t]KAF2958967.1 UDP-N-acetylmuramoylalanyl-D-glutamate--2,6-diaminopimelate ligase [Thermotoga sp. Ku-13t]